MDGLEEQYHDQLAIKRINAAVGEGPEIMDYYRLPGHPTVLIFDSQGKEQHRFFGPVEAKTLEESIQAVLEDS